jgi:hypothetical protein
VSALEDTIWSIEMIEMLYVLRLVAICQKVLIVVLENILIMLLAIAAINAQFDNEKAG